MAHRRRHRCYYPRAHPYLFRGVSEENWENMDPGDDVFKALQAKRQLEEDRQPRAVLWIEDSRTGYRRFDIDSSDLEDNYESLASDDDEATVTALLVQMRPSSPSLPRPPLRRLKRMSYVRQRALYEEQEEQDAQALREAQAAWAMLDNDDQLVKTPIANLSPRPSPPPSPRFNDANPLFADDDEEDNTIQPLQEPPPPLPIVPVQNELPENLRCMHYPDCKRKRRTRKGVPVGKLCDFHSRQPKEEHTCSVCQVVLADRKQLKCASCRRQVTAANKEKRVYFS